jgi:hypothetical protein
MDAMDAMDDMDIKEFGIASGNGVIPIIDVFLPLPFNPKSEIYNRPHQPPVSSLTRLS